MDGAGKTTIVKALQGEDLRTVHPTVGFSIANFTLKRYKITAYDLGGGERIREIWKTYYAEIYGLVFVIDSAAANRFSDNVKMVESLTEVPELVGKPILFFLNKKDLPESLDEIQFSDRFGLHNMAKRNKADIRVEGICAIKGTGKEMDSSIIEGIEWITERILDNYENISKGVNEALRKLRERQIQERLERQHRLAVMAENEQINSSGSSRNSARSSIAGDHTKARIQNGGGTVNEGFVNEDQPPERTDKEVNAEHNESQGIFTVFEKKLNNSEAKK